MKNLTSGFVKYRDLTSVVTKENNEPLVCIKKEVIPYGYSSRSADMKKVIGDNILIRKSVYRMLQKVQKILKQINRNLSLFVTYGYRDGAIQTERFLKQLHKLSKEFYPDPNELYEAAHIRVAVPTVAGHPTGGAVDIKIFNKATGKFLDFGSKQYNYSNTKYYVFSPNIAKNAKSNRKLLRDCMMEAGFAPYDGEWWHFSFGDTEWAFYYKKPYAIYGQKLLLSKKKK